jgi:hypothetical protein
MLSNNINCQKQYLFQKEYNAQTYNNGKIININEYSNVNPIVNELEQNMMKIFKMLKY